MFGEKRCIRTNSYISIDGPCQGQLPGVLLLEAALCRLEFPQKHCPSQNRPVTPALGDARQVNQDEPASVKSQLYILRSPSRLIEIMFWPMQ